MHDRLLMQGKLRQHYVLFPEELPGRVRVDFPEVRPRGWVSILVPSLVREGETVGAALVRMEDEAREIATKFFGTSWRYVSSSLSEDDFREGEVMRIEYQYAPGIEDGYAITKRQRHVEYQNHDYWEDVTGLALMDLMHNTVFARAQEIKPERVVSELEAMAQRLEEYRHTDYSEDETVVGDGGELKTFVALAREAARIIQTDIERRAQDDY